MWECPYGKEPFDLKLFVLRLIQKMWILILAAVLGFALVGGGYYLKKVVFAPQTQYEAVSTYYVEYDVDPDTGNTYTYINAYSWNMWVHTDEFVDKVIDKLNEAYRNGSEEGLPSSITADRLIEYISADVPSDVRLPQSIVTTPNQELTIQISKALEETFLEFGLNQVEIAQLRVVDSPDVASEVVQDVRTLRAAILGMLLSFFFTFVILSCYMIWDDSIYVPTTFEYRYGIKMAGCLPYRNKRIGMDENNQIVKATRELAELGVNLEYLLRDANHIAITASNAELPLNEVVEKMITLAGDKLANKHLIAIPSVEQCPEAAEKIRETDGAVLVIQSGGHDGKRIEHTLQQLHRQDCKVLCAVLWDAEEKLIHVYHGIQRK